MTSARADAAPTVRLAVLISTLLGLAVCIWPPANAFARAAGALAAAGVLWSGWLLAGHVGRPGTHRWLAMVMSAVLFAALIISRVIL